MKFCTFLCNICVVMSWFFRCRRLDSNITWWPGNSRRIHWWSGTHLHTRTCSR